MSCFHRVAMLCIHTSPLDSPGKTKDAGGMNVYIQELALELAQQGVKVDIFTRCTNGQISQVVYLHPHVRVIHIKAGPLVALHKNDLYQYTPTFARHVDEFRQREGVRYDVIHSHYWISGLAGLRLACHWSVPHIMMFHTLGRLKQMANPQEAEPPLRLEMEQRLIHHVDRVLVATNDEKSQILRYCGATAGRVTTIPCGVDLKLFTQHNRHTARRHLGLTADIPVVLYAGRLDPFKGPDQLLRATALLRQPVQVVIAGGKLREDKDLQQLRQLACDLQIEQQVRFLGAQPRDKMPWFYSAADVTVVPSYHETFGLAAVESLACGTPVVATRSGGLMTVVKHGVTGFLVPRWPSAFAERIDQLLSDHALWSRMSAAARPSIEQFGWSSVAQQIYKVYDEMVCEGYSQVAL